ncbi:hypothetical protein O181_022779 [Austropuccinia psidii MF-1]|uniref:Tf2-1-like SH3-like domain-containing protein n=1 Tax=Austropuccinia psidii MF-1 TaxID=1389203 RepID=A0A9Q3CFF5_9BASI|nr:hypothetical protein [Austropuccinia psidii MF-1]
MEPDFKEGDQVLVSTLNFNNLKGPKKMRDSFGGPFTIIKLIGKNAVEVKFTEEFSRKHPVFPNKSYGENKLYTVFKQNIYMYQKSGTWPSFAILNASHLK